MQSSSMKGYMNGFELSKMFQDEDNVDYRALPAAATQQVCKQLTKLTSIPLNYTMKITHLFTL